LVKALSKGVDMEEKERDRLYQQGRTKGLQQATDDFKEEFPEPPGKTEKEEAADKVVLDEKIEVEIQEHVDARDEDDPSS
jgi:hypothetical protein